MFTSDKPKAGVNHFLSFPAVVKENWVTFICFSIKKNKYVCILINTMVLCNLNHQLVLTNFCTEFAY